MPFSISRSNQSVLEESPAYLNEVEEKQTLSPSPHLKGDLEGRSLSLLNNGMKYVGIAALFTAFGSMMLCHEEEEHDTKFKVGYCLGSCYILAEIALILAAVSYVALRMFLKIRGS